MEMAAYRQFAELEERHFWFRGRRRIFFALLDQLPLPPHEVAVLEVGCGAGGLLRRLERYGRPVGLELSLEMSQLARERSGCPLVCASAYAIPLPDTSQDLVCLFDALEHVPDEARALKEIHRVMRPGAHAFFSVPAYQFLFANNDRVAKHERRYTRGRLTRALRAAGLEVVRATYFNTLLFPAILPAVLLGKAAERLGAVSDPDHTNLTVPIPRPLSELLYRIMGSETHWLRRGSFPFGHSLIAIARRPA